MTDPHTPVSALGRAYMSGYADGERDAIGRRPAPQYTLAACRLPARQCTRPARSDLNEWRRRAETAETALAEVRGQRDYAVTSLANMVDAAVKNSPDGTGSGWDDFPPALDTDGEPMLIADGTLAGTIRRLSGEPRGRRRIRGASSVRARAADAARNRVRLPDQTPVRPGRHAAGGDRQ
jgi:hypothetical protein